MTSPIRPLSLPGSTLEPPSKPTMFRPLDVARSGLTAQRLRMEVAAINIANAETTRTANGGPYQRRVVRLEEAVRDQAPAFPPLPLDPTRPMSQPESERAAGVEVVAIEEDATEGPLVYDPGHPDANAQGYVRMPNVRVTDEMVELMEAKTLYEANATVFQVAKAMLRRALDI